MRVISFLNAEQQAAYQRDMGYAEYKAAVRTARIVNPDWRDGQAHYNTLALMHPGVADEVTEDIDPFYVDDRLPAFLAFVRHRLPQSS